MGISTSKKCEVLSVVLEYPKKMELKFVDSNVTHAGYQIFRFDVPRKKINSSNYTFKFVFRKTFIQKNFIIYKPDLNKNILGTDKIYYNTEKIPLERGTVHLRLDSKYNLESVLVELGYQDIRALNF